MRDTPALSEKLIFRDETVSKGSKNERSRKKSTSKVRSHKLSFNKKHEIFSAGTSKRKTGSPSSLTGKTTQRRTLSTLQQSSSHDQVLVGKNGPRKVKPCGKDSPETDKPKPSEEESCTTDAKELEHLLEIPQEDTATEEEDVPVLSEDDEGVRLAQEALALMVEDPPAEMYWETLAEERRLALQDTLQENEQLHNTVDSLQKRCLELEERCKKAEHFERLYKKLCKERSSEDIQPQ